MIDVDKAIASAVKTGKIQFGANSALNGAKTKKAKLIIVASNCPQGIQKGIEYNCKLSRIPVSIYKGNSLDLGAVCGKPFEVSALTIREPGDSDILKILEAQHV
jgi:large subunit ribosomal protein L30e